MSNILTHSRIFQLTASRRGWPAPQQLQPNHSHFNSQPHEEADITLRMSTVLAFISTHSLTKRLTTQQLTTKLATPISTHSLTKRLTWAGTVVRSLIHISTHSLTKRLTILHVKFLMFCFYFNSQPHEEADRLRSNYNQTTVISTHSLTKRLTLH